MKASMNLFKKPVIFSIVLVFTLNGMGISQLVISEHELLKQDLQSAQEYFDNNSLPHTPEQNREDPERILQSIIEKIDTRATQDPIFATIQAQAHFLLGALYFKNKNKFVKSNITTAIKNLEKGIGLEKYMSEESKIYVAHARYDLANINYWVHSYTEKYNKPKEYNLSLLQKVEDPLKKALKYYSALPTNFLIENQLSRNYYEKALKLQSACNGLKEYIT